MKYLIDSHVYVWLLAQSKSVGSVTKNILTDSDATVFISLASLWELGLKSKSGKLPLTVEELHEGVEALGISTLSITLEHLLTYNLVGLPHNDPFDTMLCAQSLSQDMKLVTADKLILENHQKSLDAKL